MPLPSILFIHHANDMYGADIGLLHSISSLDRGRFHPIVLLPADMPPPGPLSSELERLGIEYHVVPLGILRRKYLAPRKVGRLLLDIVRGSLAVRRLVRQRQVALVYVNTIVTVSGAIGSRLAGAPVLWHVREILAMPRPARWVLHRALQLCADRVVCISSAVRESLLVEAPALKNKSLVLYNAISVAACDADDGSSSLREEWGVPPDAPLIGMVGRVTHWKGQEVLAEAAASLATIYPDAHFVAVGGYFADEDHYLHKLKSLIKTLELEGRFHLADYRANVTDVYRTLDIFVLPSRKPEPFGRVTVEAMTQGRPVIATNHGGTPELIQEGETGMLIPPSDPEALVRAINILLKDAALRERMGQKAAKFAQEHFNLPRYQLKMRDVMDGIVASAR